jgi:hypothetical protein
LKADALQLAGRFNAGDTQSRSDAALNQFDQPVILGKRKRRLGSSLRFNVEMRMIGLQPSQHFFAFRRAQPIRCFQEIGNVADHAVFHAVIARRKRTAPDQKRGADAEVKNNRRDDEQQNDLRRNLLRKTYLHELLCLDGLREYITAGPDRLDQFRIARIDFDLLAQAADENIDAALERSRHPALRDLKQLIA